MSIKSTMWLRIGEVFLIKIPLKLVISQFKGGRHMFIVKRSKGRTYKGDWN